MHLTVEIPIPEYVLSKNGSHGTPRKRNQLFQQAKTDAYNCIIDAKNRQLDSQPSWSGDPWAGPVVVFAAWFATHKPFPDYDNLVARLSPAMDAAQAAGLFENDRQITGILTECIVDAEPRVELTFIGTDEATWKRSMVGFWLALVGVK